MSLFVTLEGIEGSGKSTLQRSVQQSLQDLGYPVLCTREPGATTLGAKIRSLLLEPNLEPISSQAELLLFSADRAEHVAKVLRPSLSEGKLVLCDRYIHSTIAYQGYGRGLSLESLRAPIEFASDGLLPDLVLVLDLDPKLGLGRAKSRAQTRLSGEDSEWTRFEEEELAFHTKVRNGFLELAKSNADTFVVLDATQTPEALTEQALDCITARLDAK